MNQRLELADIPSDDESLKFSLPLSDQQQTAYYRLLVVFDNDYLEVEAHMLSLAEQA